VPATTDLLPGQLVDKVVLDRENARMRKEKKEQATWEPLILGSRRRSLATESSSLQPPSRRRPSADRRLDSRARVDRLLG